MKRFIEYLQERAFLRGKDVDFTVDDKYVLCFDEKDKDTYKPTGDSTHGAASHSLKHLAEFDPQTMRNVTSAALAAAVEFIKSNPDHFCGILNTKGSFVATGNSVLSKIDVYIIGNTMDLINDKILTKKTLLPIEKKIAEFTKKIEKRYVDLIDSKIDKAIDLDSIKEEELVNAIKNAKIIKFDGFQGTMKQIYLDFTDNSIIITTPEPEKIRTMFSFDRDASSKKDIIKNFMGRKIEIENKSIARALKLLNILYQ
jgi:hypothetical protein